MKKIILPFLLLFTVYILSQEKNYGISTHLLIADSDLSDEISAGGSPGFRIGIYYDYQLNQSFGIRSTLGFSKIKDAFIDNNSPNVYRSNLDLLSFLKYDLNSEYDKGFYLLAGPRISYVISAINNDNNLDDIYKKTNFGLVFGFGFDISSFLEIEFTGDYGFTDITLSPNFETKTLGGNLSLFFNISGLLK